MPRACNYCDRTVGDLCECCKAPVCAKCRYDAGSVWICPDCGSSGVAAVQDGAPYLDNLCRCSAVYVNE